MSVKGKKIAGFLAFPHHTRFFLPIREEIRKQKGDLVFITPLSDYPYEIDMMKRNLAFRYFPDYMTGDVKDKINAGLSGFFDKWATTCFKWEGFGRWPIFKETWLLKELVEEYFCMEKFIEVEKPDMFLAHHECTRWGKIIGHLCFKNRIPFVTFQEGDYYAHTLGNAIHTEYSTADLLWGSITKKRLAGYTCSPDKMYTIGNTHIDGAIKEYSRTEVIKKIKAELAIPPDKKVILFLVGVKYGPIKDKNIWLQLVNGLERIEKDAVFIFKWHPNVPKGIVVEIMEMFKEILPTGIMLDNYDPYKLIAVSDYCVSLGQTTLTIEALAFGKPLFSVPDPDTSYDDYVNNGVAQSVYYLGNWTNLFTTMEKGVPDAIQNSVGRFLADNFYKLDGKSAERAIEVISYIFKTRENKEKETGTGQKPVQKKIQREFTSGKFSFIIPSGNDPEALLATLTSLSQNVKYPDWEVVVVVNNEIVMGVLSGMSGDLIIVEHAGNVLATLYNRGAEVSSGEYLVFMRPGIVYFKDEGVVGAMDEGIAGIPIKNKDMTPYCLGIGYDFNYTPYFIKEDSTLNAERPTLNAYRDAVGGGLIGVRSKMFGDLGGFDEGVANHLIEPDICLKAKELNIPIRYLPETLAFNYKETFFGDDISEENWKNRVKFFAKWVGKLPKNDDFLHHTGDMMKV